MDQSPTSPPRPGRSVETRELGVFLLLIVPSLVLSFFARGQGSVSFVLLALATIARDLSLIALVLYFLWRNGEPVARIGWRLRRTAREVGLGVVLFVPMLLATGGLGWALQRAGLSAPKTPLPALEPAGGAEVPLAVLLVAVVAIAEETIFRGYLILRLRSTAGGAAPAVILSSVIFAVGHGYEGSAGVVTVGMMGVALALVYLWRRNLTATITMHFLQDFAAIVLAPWLGASLQR